MSHQVEGGRPIARFRVFGFPVHIDVSFLIIIGLLGYSAGTTIPGLVVWVLVATAAILVHELGHAVLAHAAGARPAITLAGLGGVTTFVPPRPLSRARSIGISVAGPLTGVVIGVVLLFAARAADPLPFTLQDQAWQAAIFTTLGWGVLNLLPILPLDGGQVLRELLPGDPMVRARRAAMVSVAVGAVVGLLAWRAGYTFGAVLAAFFVVSNVLSLRGTSRAPRGNAESSLQQPRGAQEQALQALWEGRPDLARDALAAPLPQGAPDVDGAVRLAVACLVEPDAAERDRARAALGAQVLRRPGDGLLAGLVPLTDALAGRWPDVVAAFTGPGGVSVPPAVALRVQELAFHSDAFEPSARIGEAVLARPDSGGVAGPTLAYNTACGWARAGDPERGLAAFRRAGELGFADLRAVDSDDDLAGLRGQPGYFEARDVIRRTALAQQGA